MAAEKNYDQTNYVLQVPLLQHLLDTVNVEPNSKCVDIGCRSGHSSRALLARLGDKGKVVGIDTNAKRIALAKRTNRGKSRMKFHADDGRQICMYAKKVDLVLSNLVFSWLPHSVKEDMFRNIYKSLKPGGRFIFNTLDGWCDVERFMLKELPPKTADKLIKSLHYFTSRAEIKEMALRCGFKVERLVRRRYDIAHDSIDVMFRLMAACLHGVEYETVLETYQRLFVRGNHDFLECVMNEADQTRLTGKCFVVVLVK